MTDREATDMATKLLTSYGDRAFEISMPDKAGYDLMRTTFARLGRPTGPDGEFFVVKVFPVQHDSPPRSVATAFSPTKR